MINKSLILAITILVSTIVFGAETEKKVRSKVKEVTVFLQGAQIKRKGRFSLEKGITKLVFEGITKNFNTNSIQAKGRGNFVILDVSHNVFYPVPKKIEVPSTIPAKTQREIKQVNDSLSRSNWKLKQYRASLEVYNSEKNILLSSGVIKGQNQNDSIPLLKDALVYLREKLIEINQLILQTEKSIEKETAIRTQLTNRLNTLNNWKNHLKPQQQESLSPIYQIIVTVSCDVATSGSLEISYNTSNAGWSPSYDLRADQVNAPVKLTYKAKVYQNTGINWDNVNVTLSTINPNRNNNKPVLAPWYISYYRPIQRGAFNYSLDDVSVNKETAAMPSIANVDELSDEVEAKHISNFTQMSNNMAMVEFELKLPYSIPSDGKEHLMAVNSDEIDAEFEYFAVPKKEREAFLMAKLTGWEDLNLLPAVANIYYDGTYVGQTRISPSTMTDTLELALGRDRRIIVEQKKISNEEKIKKLSNEKESTLTYQITVKSMKSSHVKLTIMDQIPLTNVEEIKVNLINKGKANYNQHKGFLTWNTTINPRETKKIKYVYSITYNKDKNLVL
ncbi:MAG: DUF4139 domain-containing protein [Flavobacteriales bacterium]|jgi:uncharacterized protein (TIGR02231 family)|nr:DUF4139 domain-containing protein [Flavobacteriales bacterium]